MNINSTRYTVYVIFLCFVGGSKKKIMIRDENPIELTTHSREWLAHTGYATKGLMLTKVLIGSDRLGC